MIDAGGDGFRQHFRALLYYSNILKEMFGSLFSGHFTIPQWDHVIGEGSDILQAFHYYAAGDLFTFFSFLCPEKYMYLYYDGSTLMRMYCAGLAFSLLCFYKKKNDRFMLLAGSLLYAFCAFNVFSMVGHVFFISASVWLPLIILGAEMAISNDCPFLLPLAVMCSALGNIYFFYINVIGTIIFVAVRLLCLETSWKERFLALIRVAAYSALGVVMACVIFLPMLLTMLGNTRMSVSVNVPFLYSLSDYLGMLNRLTFSNYSYRGGFSILWLPAYLCLLLKKRNKTLIALSAAALLFACFPKLASVFNAFTYPTERWYYCISLLVSYVIVDSFDDVKAMNDCFLFNIIACVCYYALCIYTNRLNLRMHALLLVMALGTILLIRIIKNRKLCGMICTAATVVFLLLQMFYLFSPGYWDLRDNGISISQIEDKLQGETAVFNQIKDDSFFRYSGYSLVENATIQGQHSSTQYYWSIINDYIVDYRTQLGNSDRSLYHIQNYGERFAQNALAGVKYYINEPDQYVPYGFEYLDTVNGFEIWQSKYNLPLAFAYDNYILPEEWEQLDLAGKNETLLQAAYIAHPVDGIDPYPIQLDHTEIPYQMSLGSNIKVKEHEISVKGKDAYIYLDAKSDQVGEYYVMVQGLHSTKMTAYIRCNYGEIMKYFIFKGSDNQHYTDRHDYLVDLGYFDGIDGTISLDFTDGGDYTYDSIKIVCQPLDHQIECIDKLKEIAIDELEVKKNAITAKVVTDEDKLVCFSVPYSKGWKAYVDGEKTELLCCDLQYMAVKLSPGSHTIELRYSTPYLKTGAFLSAAGLLAYAYLMTRKQKDRSR